MRALLKDTDIRKRIMRTVARASVATQLEEDSDKYLFKFCGMR